MPFYKIKDPILRDAAVKEFLALKNRLRLKDYNERLAKSGFEETLGKIFKPVTDESKKVQKEIRALPFEQLRQQIEGIPAGLVKAIGEEQKKEEASGESSASLPSKVKSSLPLPLLGDEEEEEDEEEDEDEISSITAKEIYPTEEPNAYLLGKKGVKIRIDPSTKEVIYMGDTFNNANLVELLTKKVPSKEAQQDSEAYNIYANILVHSNVLHQHSDSKNSTPAKSLLAKDNTYKWNNILKPIWYNRFQYMDEKRLDEPEIKDQMRKAYSNLIGKNSGVTEKTYTKTTLNLIKDAYDLYSSKPSTSGKGITKGGKINPIIIPESIKELGDKLRTLWASKLAGNTGLRNHIVAICDALRKKNAIKHSDYATIMNEL